MPIVLDGTNGEVPASWTTAGRPASPSAGQFGYNTTLGTGEMYTSAGWVSFPDLSPVINSITGGIYTAYTTTLTLNGSNFGSGAGTVNFSSGATTASVSATPSSTTVVSAEVPSAITALPAGSVVLVSFTNSLGKLSNSVSKTMLAVPTGGTITTNGSYRIHTFTTSGSLIVPASFTSSADYLIIAGGGGGGHNTAPPQFSGGGAGGVLTSTTTLASSTTYNFVVGGGGAPGVSGQNSTGFSLTAIGGGYGGGGGGANGGTGGSGGGQGGSGSPGGTPTNAAGTSGQGNAGGSATFGADAAGGGGGYSSVGQNAVSTTSGNGGLGLVSSISGTSVNYAGGGGRLDQGYGGGYSGSPNGVANRGGGGAGTAGSGGSGIVIVRYPLPT